MATNVLVPRLGEGVDEVTVSRWLKKVGETIKELEPLLEVNTDKVDTEIPAPVSGVVLSIALQEGVVARVGEVLAVIGQPGEAAETGTPAPVQPASPQLSAASRAKPEVAPAGKMPATPPQELGFISPVVARIAGEHGVDLQQVRGTGLGGRITKNDVLAFIENGAKKQAEASLPARPVLLAVPAGPPAATSPTDTLVRHTLMRKQIAEHMQASRQNTPHVLTVMEVDMSRVLAHRSANKAAYARDGLNLTYTAYFLSAIVAGLKAYPLVNSSWTAEGVLIHAAIHLGMATSLGEEGLIVPVIKNADSLSLTGMSRAVNDLAARARAKKLLPEEVRGGTFTLTNHGISGSLFAMPIINQPQCGILGVGALQKRAVVVTDPYGNDALAIRPMVYLSFVFDHRILDGASADWFLAKVKDSLEKWSE